MYVTKKHNYLNITCNYIVHQTKYERRKLYRMEEMERRMLIWIYVIQSVMDNSPELGSQYV